MPATARPSPHNQPYIVRELLTDPRVHFIGEYVTDDELEQFIHLFRATWRRLPDGVHRVDRRVVAAVDRRSADLCACAPYRA